MTGGVIGPAAIGTGWTAPPGGPPQADPGCCCGPCEGRPKRPRRGLNRRGRPPAPGPPSPGGPPEAGGGGAPRPARGAGRGGGEGGGSGRQRWAPAGQRRPAGRPRPTQAAVAVLVSGGRRVPAGG